MDREISVCRANTGIGNVIGNATAIVRDFVKSLFPDGYFSDEYIDTSMSQIELKKSTIVKKKKPCLVIRPKITLGEDSFFQRLPDWMSTNMFLYTNLDSSYSPVLKDSKNNIYIYTAPDRITMKFDIDIVTDTKIEQLNTAFFLKGSVLHKSYFYLKNARLETEVPKYYIKQLADILGYNLGVEEERIQFSDYLNSNSQSFITEKIKLSSGNSTYFYTYGCNMLCLFEDYPDIDEGEVNEMISSNFRISESLSVEFWTPLNYIMEIGKKFNKLKVNNKEFLNAFNEKVTLNCTLKFSVPEEKYGKTYYKKLSFLTDDDPEKDELDLTYIFGYNHNLIYNYCIAKNYDMTNLFHIDVYYNNSLLDVDFIKINWSKKLLINFKPIINDTYTLVLYENKPMINNIIKRLEENHKLVYN